MASPDIFTEDFSAAINYLGTQAYIDRNRIPKELVIVPKSAHTDFYDRMDKIPFDKIYDFSYKNITK